MHKSTPWTEGWKRDVSKQINEIIGELREIIDYKSKKDGYEWLTNLEKQKKKILRTALIGSYHYYNYYHYINPMGINTDYYMRHLSLAAKEVWDAYSEAKYYIGNFPKEWEYPGYWDKKRVKEAEEPKNTIKSDIQNNSVDNEEAKGEKDSLKNSDEIRTWGDLVKTIFWVLGTCIKVIVKRVLKMD